MGVSRRVGVRVGLRSQELRKRDIEGYVTPKRTLGCTVNSSYKKTKRTKEPRVERLRLEFLVPTVVCLGPCNYFVTN